MVAHSTLASADFVFPDEVFLRIFKLLCPAIHIERWALRDCLLTCRRFYRIAWTHTFSYVVLKGDQASSEPFSHCLQYLLDTSNNHLLPVIQHLARKGAKVYIAGRSEQRVKAAIERLRADGLEPGNGAIDWHELDLSDPRKAKASAESFAEKEKRVDVLGVYALSRCSAVAG